MTPIKSSTKTGEVLVIREAVKADAPLVIECAKQVAGETDFLLFTPEEFMYTVEEEEKLFEKMHQADNQIFLLAEVDGVICGILTVGASPRSRVKHVCEFGISVRQAHRGKGVGYQLMRTMLDWAKETGVIRKVNLKVITTNEIAIALYQKLGFQLEGTLTRDFFLHGKYYDSHYMGLPIN